VFSETTSDRACITPHCVECHYDTVDTVIDTRDTE
jgi:hypothetical protein